MRIHGNLNKLCRLTLEKSKDRHRAILCPNTGKPRRPFEKCFPTTQRQWLARGWENKSLDAKTDETKQEILVDFNDFLKTHHFDFRINQKIESKFTTNGKCLEDSQKLSTWSILKMISMFILHTYIENKILPPFPSPKTRVQFFSWENQKNLWLLIHRRKKSSMLTNDYTSENHAVITVTDAAQHGRQKNRFEKWIVHWHITALILII